MTLEHYDAICEYLRTIIKGTAWEGHVYAVGGCCRDALMQRDINDVDLAVTRPNGGVTFANWLEQNGYTLSPPTLYRRFSTSKLHLKAFPDDEIEIVQTRREQYTDANCHTPEVCFGSLKDDCDRRDLTINSLYRDITTNEILDLTGRGINDIKNRRIDTPMSPGETYSDDPIRILRTLRFAIRYGWRIPNNVFEAMKRNANRMKIVRRPRIATEFDKIMRSNDPARLLQLMKEVGVIYRVVPELCHLFRVKDHSKREKLGPQAPLPTLWQNTMERLSKAGDNIYDRYAALFWEFNKVKTPYTQSPKRDRRQRSSRRGHGRSTVAGVALKRLMYDNDFIKKVKARYHGNVGDTA